MTTNRRTFVKQAAALGLGISAGTNGKALEANDKINVACIGVRGGGNFLLNLFAAQPDCDVTHICDVYEPMRAQRGAEQKDSTGKMPMLVNDYRTMLRTTRSTSLWWRRRTIGMRC